MEAEWIAKRATLRWRLAYLSPVDTERLCRLSALLSWLGEEVEKASEGGGPR
jgi:hypothetical protein